MGFMTPGISTTEWMAERLADALTQRAEASTISRDGVPIAAPLSNLERRVQDLEERVKRLLLVNSAMWSLFAEKLGCTDEDLAARMEELDLKDGRKDGVVQAGLHECPSCRRKVSPKRDRCLYCGSALGVPPHAAL